MVMLGSSCSPCCSSDGCGCPDGEPYPHRVTVALSGLTHSSTKLENLLGLSFSAPFGSGASGTVSAQGGPIGTGFPITGVSLTGGGSGYAKLGRVAPELNISSGGSGATFTPTFSVSQDSNGIPTWSIKSIAASGGTGYTDGEQLTITVGNNTTEVSAASVTLSTNRAQPIVAAAASGGGSGASLSVTLAPRGTTPETWSVSEITITNGGTGYPATGYVEFSLTGGGTQEQSAYAAYYCGRTQPTVTATAYGSGSGATLTPSLTQGQDWQGRPVWYVDSVTINDGGSGYSEWEYVAFSSPDGEGYGYGVIGSVDENGAITSVYVYYSEFYKSNGVIESIEFYPEYNGGIYYRDAGTIASVSVGYGGIYFREDASAQPYVANVTVSVTQSPPSNGSGAAVTATVDQNTSSQTFGQISSLTLTAQGAGYLGWSWDECLLSALNGRSFTLPRVRAMAAGSFAKTGTLLSIDFASSIGGFGATTKIVAPGGDEDVDNGPIASVTLTDGGSGYARIGREQPSLSIQSAVGSNGAGATFTPTFSQHQDEYGLDYWVVESVAVSGGSCYGLGGRTGPGVYASVSGGTGLFLSVTASPQGDACGGTHWVVSDVSVSVANNWTPYANGSQVTFTATEGVTRTQATATLQTNEIGRPTSVTITNPGSYFIKGPDEQLRVTPATTNDKQQQQAVLTIQTDDNGTPTGVTVLNGGAYYRENKSLPPYSPGVNVVLSQLSPSKGTGAAFTATVNDDPYSADFGKISSITMSSGGNGYLLWAYPRTCLYSRCTPVRGMHYAWYGNKESTSAAQITVELRGPRRPPEVRVTIGSANDFAPCPCRSCATSTITLTADSDDAPFGCEGALFTATEQFGGTATVTAGSSGEPCYEQILAANSLSVTLHGENAEFTVQRPQPSYQVNRPWDPLPDNPHCFQLTYDQPPNRVRVRLTGGKTNGADLAGTFSCELVEQFPNGAKRFLYEMGQVCGLPWGSWPGADQTLGSKPMLVLVELSPVSYSLTGVQQGNGYVSIYGLATKWKGVESDGIYDDTDGGEVSESCRTTTLTSGGSQAFPCFGDITNIRGAVVSPIVFRSGSDDYPQCNVTWSSDPNISIDSIEIE